MTLLKSFLFGLSFTLLVLPFEPVEAREVWSFPSSRQAVPRNAFPYTAVLSFSNPSQAPSSGSASAGAAYASAPGSCSGALVAKVPGEANTWWAVSATHCELGGRSTVKANSRRLHRRAPYAASGRVLSFHPWYGDLALVKIRFSDVRYDPGCFLLPEPSGSLVPERRSGQPLATAGYDVDSGEDVLKADRGCKTLRVENSSRSSVRTDCQVTPGASGGPAFVYDPQRRATYLQGVNSEVIFRKVENLATMAEGVTVMNFRASVVTSVTALGRRKGSSPRGTPGLRELIRLSHASGCGRAPKAASPSSGRAEQRRSGTHSGAGTGND